MEDVLERAVLLKWFFSLLCLNFSNFLCPPTISHTYCPYSRLSGSLSIFKSEPWISIRISRVFFKAPMSESHVRTMKSVSLREGTQSSVFLESTSSESNEQRGWRTIALHSLSFAHLSSFTYHHVSLPCPPCSSHLFCSLNMPKLFLLQGLCIHCSLAWNPSTQIFI